MQGYIYLATPYTGALINGSPPKSQSDLDSVCENLVILLHEYMKDWKVGEPVIYSPIVHWHEPAREGDLPKDASYWLAMDLEMLRPCTELWVYTGNPGWRTSAGVNQEIGMAITLGKPIKYISWYDPEDDEEYRKKNAQPYGKLIVTDAPM